MTAQETTGAGPGPGTGQGGAPDRPDPDGSHAAEEAAPGADAETAPWSGPSAWVFPGIVLAFGLVALWGAATIEAPPETDQPGPTLFPGLVGALLVAVAVGMAVQNVRRAWSLRAQGADAAQAPSTEWPPVLIVAAALMAHIALLSVLGWLLAGALLFWGVAYAFGARDYLRDAIVALAMSSAVQVAFSMGLGLSLPGGVLGAVL